MGSVSIANPKRSRTQLGRDGWYPYYAGYSTEFTASALRKYAPVQGKPVLDPWNGGGTTTQVSAQLGLASIGCDINPVMIVVAKARRLQGTVKGSIRPLATQIIHSCARTFEAGDHTEDPLTAWFIPKAVASIRQLERSIRTHFLPHSSSPVIASDVCTSQFSDLAAYFYLLLFRAVRALLKSCKSSNPTWLRVPENRRRLRPSPSEISAAFFAAIAETLPGVDNATRPFPDQLKSSVLHLCDSRSLPFETRSIGAVLTSPPYLTRIDYAVSTAPELAILGVSSSQVRALRATMLGTTTVSGYGSPSRLGGYADWCLDKISLHTSKASKSYYHKNIAQYFCGMKDSLGETSRVLAPLAPVVLVVQDSFYKDVHLDLPRVVQEFGEMHGLRMIDTHPFEVQRHLGRVHPHHRKHCSQISRTECVVVMQKKDKDGSYAN